MDADRRSRIAAVGTVLLDDLHEQVIASWPDGTPLARAASRVALGALLTVFEQGDLDERTTERVRSSVLAATASLDEADELLRTVRVVGVGRLSELLADRIGLSHKERWELQREASALGPELLGLRDERVGGSGAGKAGWIEALLTELERSGPDLR